MPRRALGHAAALACALLSGHAAAMSPDPTGLWYDPAESGWGLMVAQQGGTGFAVLFVYDQNHNPAWYVASDLETPETFGPVAGGSGLSGTLYRTMGPWFGGSFDPRAVTMTPAGTLILQYPDANAQSLRAIYMIDGIAVTKSLQPQTWGDGRTLLLGSYEGGLTTTFKSAANCDDLYYGPINRTMPFNFQVGTTGTGQLTISWTTGIDTYCQATGDYAQRGQLGSFSGQLQCGTAGAGLNPVTTVALQLTGLAITANGFAGGLSLQRGACTYSGNVGGVRTLGWDFAGR